MAGPTKTAQNSWVSPFGEDYLQLLSSNGGVVQGGIDSTGTPYGALGGLSVPVVLIATSDAVVPLTLLAHGTTATPQLTVLHITANSAVDAIVLDTTQDAMMIGAITAAPPYGLLLVGSSDGDVTEASLALTSDNLGGTYWSSGTLGAINIKAGVITVEGSMVLEQLLTSYNGITTVRSGFASEVAQVNLTAQAAAISATTVYAVPAAGAGQYRISFVAKVTQAATTSCVLGGAAGFQVIYTDQDDSVVVTTPSGVVFNSTTAGLSINTTQNVYSGQIIVNAKASTNIQYAIGYTSVGGTVMQYNLHVTVEAL